MASQLHVSSAGPIPGPRTYERLAPQPSRPPATREGQEGTISSEGSDITTFSRPDGYSSWLLAQGMTHLMGA